MRASVRPVIGLLAGLLIGLALSAGPGWASRNSVGTYSLPSGNPVVSGTTITSTWANNTLTDIKTEITNSLDRGGRGAMTAPLQFSAGTVSLPSATFSGDLSTGLYRVGASNPAMAAGGVQAQSWTSTGSTFPLTCTITGAATTQKGLAATNSVTNGDAVTATGNGNGSGLNATGGGAGVGVTAKGGATGYASGGEFTGGTYPAGGNGIKGTGVAGSITTTAAGGVFVGAGTNSGYGVQGTGGTTSPGGFFAGGTAATTAVAQDAVTLNSGNLAFSTAVNPNSTVVITNRLTPKNLIKVWADISPNNTASPTVNDGFNLGTVSDSNPAPSGNIRIAFASSFTSTNYAAIATSDAIDACVNVGLRNAGYIEVGIFTCDTGTPMSQATYSGKRFSLVVLGAQ